MSAIDIPRNVSKEFKRNFFGSVFDDVGDLCASLGFEVAFLLELSSLKAALPLTGGFSERFMPSHFFPANPFASF